MTDPHGLKKQPGVNLTSDRPGDDYMPSELKEQQGVLPWCRRYGSSVARIKMEFSVEALLKKNSRVEKEVQVQEPTRLIDHEAVLVDSNGTEFVWYTRML